MLGLSPISWPVASPLECQVHGVKAVGDPRTPSTGTGPSTQWLLKALLGSINARLFTSTRGFLTCYGPRYLLTCYIRTNSDPRAQRSRAWGSQPSGRRASLPALPAPGAASALLWPQRSSRCVFPSPRQLLRSLEGTGLALPCTPHLGDWVGGISVRVGGL